MMNICVVGTGYVGLVTGTCFAEMGNRVVCIDIAKEKIDALNQGRIPIYEPGLEEMVHRNRDAGRLSFTTDLAEGVQSSLFVFISVGTPPGPNGSADLSSVLGVARGIGKVLNEYKIIVTKSTVPVGTTEKVRQAIREELEARDLLGLEFDVVSNPEFLKEGAAIEDFMRPDRIVIGTDNVRTAELMKELYSPFVRNGHPILAMDIPSSELTKYASNSMLALRISFMNELAAICDSTGADIEQIRWGIGTDSRIGMAFLYAGLGYGGSCFPKDVQALVQTALQNDVEPHILRAVETVNQAQKRKLIELVTEKYGEDLRGRVFAVWGLSFKPQTDDMREASSIVTIQGLLERGAKIRAHDPVAIPTSRNILGKHGVDYFENNYDALDGADALLLVTEWREFRNPDFDRIKRLLKEPVVFDGRNQYDPEKMREMNFDYYCIGRNKYRG